VFQLLPLGAYSKRLPFFDGMNEKETTAVVQCHDSF
jgi:hypothetical protein